MPHDKKDLVAVRDKEGKFLPGNNLGKGRPAGSKNKITLLKAALEESVREETYDDIRAVLQLVIKQALEGDKSSQRLVWDASMSKGIQASDKEAKTDKGFTVHHMHHDVNDDKGKDNG